MIGVVEDLGEGIESEEIPFDRVRTVDVANRNYALDVDRREYKKKVKPRPIKESFFWYSRKIKLRIDLRVFLGM